MLLYLKTFGKASNEKNMVGVEKDWTYEFECGINILSDSCHNDGSILSWGIFFVLNTEIQKSAKIRK